MRNIIKYSNRKLYDKDNSVYTSINELLKGPIDAFRVTQRYSKEDVTIEVLLNSLATKQPKETKVKVMQYLIGKLG